VSRAYDRAKQYYTLVGLPADEVVRLAGDRPGRFSVAEWEALLLVRFFLQFYALIRLLLLWMSDVTVAV
jgi:hypothetical protein